MEKVLIFFSFFIHLTAGISYSIKLMKLHSEFLGDIHIIEEPTRSMKWDTPRRPPLPTKNKEKQE